MSSYIVPVVVIFVIVYASIKKTNCYNSFVNGAYSSIDLCFSVLPNIVAIFIIIELLSVSGVLASVANFLSPVFSLIGIPKEVCHLILFKPLSGSGSLAILKDILAQYGADSYIGRCASCIMACSETTFYVTTVYLSKTSTKKLLYAVPVSLLAMVIGAVVACLLCRII